MEFLWLQRANDLEYLLGETLLRFALIDSLCRSNRKNFLISLGVQLINDNRL